MHPHKYPKGFKQYRVLQMIEANGGATYTEIIKLAYEMSNGLGSFDQRLNRGYWSGAFKRSGKRHFGGYEHGSWIERYCSNINNEYILNGNGKVALYTLTTKFEGLTNAEAALQHARKKEMGDTPLENFDKRNKEKATRVECTNSMVGIEKPSPKVLLRGLKIDDVVLYYRKRNGASGEGFVQSITETSQKVSGPRFEIEIGIVGLAAATIPQISYNEIDDAFYEMGGHEIHLIKKA